MVATYNFGSVYIYIMHRISYHIRKNAFALTFEPKIWDYSIPSLRVIRT